MIGKASLRREAWSGVVAFAVLLGIDVVGIETFHVQLGILGLEGDVNRS